MINSGNVTSVPNFTVNFESDGTEFGSMGEGGGSTYSGKLCYVTSGGYLEAVATILPSPMGAYLKWTDEAYRTITLDEPATGDFLTWLQANAVKQ